ncbi:hypothetical protein KJ678_01495 [Patescibacteria group bacterium]|nr:hypothetical protein [Patescibacteria group bacterium]
MELPKKLTTVTTLSKILAGTLFILLPFVGFYLGLKYQVSLSPKDAIPPTVSTSVKTPTTSPDPTVDWKIYNGKDYTYKYPPDWRAEVGYLFSYDESLLHGKSNGYPVPEDQLKADFIWLEWDGQPLKEWILKRPWIQIASGYPTPKPCEQKEISDIRVDSEKGLETLLYCEDDLGRFDLKKSFFITFSRQQKVLMVNIYPYSSQLISTFDQILSTFKFL